MGKLREMGELREQDSGTAQTPLISIDTAITIVRIPDVLHWQPPLPPPPEPALNPHLTGTIPAATNREISRCERFPRHRVAGVGTPPHAAKTNRRCDRTLATPNIRGLGCGDRLSIFRANRKTRY